MNIDCLRLRTSPPHTVYRTVPTSKNPARISPLSASFPFLYVRQSGVSFRYGAGVDRFSRQRTR